MYKIKLYIRELIFDQNDFYWTFKFYDYDIYDQTQLNWPAKPINKINENHFSIRLYFLRIKGQSFNSFTLLWYRGGGQLQFITRTFVQKLPIINFYLLD